MKKTTKKTSTATPASAAKTVVRKAAATITKAAASLTKAAAPAKKKTSALSESPSTFISAKVDVGFGNHLYLRGTGPGLSWDHGIAMDCVAADIWTASLKNVKEPVTFKLLVNDVVWSTGNDYLVEPGQSVTVTPSF